MTELYSLELKHQTALIHSIITLNISDQWTRSKVQKEKIQTVSFLVKKL